MNEKTFDRILIAFVVIFVVLAIIWISIAKRQKLHPTQGHHHHHHGRSTKFERKLFDKHGWGELVDKNHWHKFVDKKKWHELVEERKWHQWISERKGWDRVDKKNWHKTA